MVCITPSGMVITALEYFMRLNIVVFFFYIPSCVPRRQLTRLAPGVIPTTAARGGGVFRPPV